MGAICHLCVIILMLAYSYAKLLVLFEIKDINIIEIERDMYFDDSERFTAEDDELFIAAGLTNYDSNRTVTESPEYGELLIEHFGWGNEDIGKSYGTHAIPNHFCSDEELGFEKGPKTRAFTVSERSLREVETYQRKFKCVDEEHMRVWGNFNSAKAMQLQIKFHMCHGEDYCKSRAEILDWLSGKYIVLLYNERRFLNEVVNGESIREELRLTYVPVSSQIRELIPFSVHVADAEV